MAKLEELLISVKGDLSDFDAKMKKLDKSVDDLSKRMQKVGSNLTKFVTLPLTGIGAGAVLTAGKFEQLEIAFKTMTGSAEEGAKVFERLKKFSAETPFQLEDIAKAEKILLAFKFSTEESLDSLKFLGDIAAGTNVPIADLAQILGKVKAKGKAMTEEIMQLAERGIPIIDVLAERFNVSKEAILDMASKSQISFDVVKDALKSMSEEGGTFEGMMKSQSQSILGLFSTLKDNVVIAMAEMGNAIAETLNLKEVIPKLTSLINSLVEKFKNLSEPAKRMIVIFGGIAAAVGPVMLAVGKLLPFITNNFTGIVKVVKTSMNAIKLVMAGNPFGLLAVAVATVAGVIIANWDRIVDYFTKGEGVAFFNTFKAVISNAWETIKDIFQGAFNLILKIAGNFYNILRDMGDVFAGLFTGDWQQLANGLLNIWKRLFSIILDVLEWAVTNVLKLVGKLVSVFDKDWGNAINKAVDSIKEFRKGIDKYFKLEDVQKEAEDTAKTIETKLIPSVKETEKVIKSTGKAVNSLVEGLEKVNKLQGKKIDIQIDAKLSQRQGGVDLNVTKFEDKQFEFINKLKNSFDTITKSVLPAFGNAMFSLGQTIFSNIKFGDSLMAFARGDVIGGLIGGFQEVINSSQAFKDLFGFINESIGKSLAKLEPLFSKLTNSMKPLGKIMGKYAQIMGKILNDILTPLVPIFMQLFKNSVRMMGLFAELAPTIGEVLAALFELFIPIQESFIPIIQLLIPVINLLLKALVPLIQLINLILTPVIKALAFVMLMVIGAIITFVNAVIDLINNVLPKDKKIEKLSIPEIPALAHGGIVTAPTIAQVGEAGPEAVIPLSKLDNMMNKNVSFVIRGDRLIGVEARAYERLSRF
jgi:tape measure domain-containing protein